MASTILTEFNFLYPIWFACIPLIWIAGVILLVYFNKNNILQDNIIYQHTSIFLLSKTTEVIYKKNNSYFILFLIGLSLSVAALTRPQSFSDWIPEEPIGHEVVLLIDISQSMSIRDYNYKGKNITRFDVLKGIVNKFISDRPKDHFSIVVFSSKAATLVPMTKDRNLVKVMLDRLTLGLLGEDTAIGDALALSIKQFKNINRPLLIMFSDGDNTGGGINPSEALALANTLNFKIYTVAITSKKSRNSSPAEQEFKNLAVKTGGKHYHAKNSFSLQKIINDINKLEKTITPEPTKRKILEWYYIPLLLGILFITWSQFLVNRR